ncbi:MAG: AAA family ATPase [Dehalococcoidia bacterium]
MIDKLLEKRADPPAPSVSGGEVYLWCPFHDDGNRPNLRLNAAKAVWYCDVCTQGGSFADLERRLGLNGHDTKGFIRLDDPWLFFEQRGLPREFVTQQGVGLTTVRDGKPAFEFNSGKVRPLGERYFWRQEPALRPPFWPIPPSAGETDTTIILTAGETDCLTTRYAGFENAYAVTKGEGTVPWPSAFRALRVLGYTEAVVLFDLDDAGEVGAPKVAEAAARAGLPAKVAKLKDAVALRGGKDVSDLFRLLRFDRDKLRHAISNAVEGAVEVSVSFSPPYREKKEIETEPTAWQPLAVTEGGGEGADVAWLWGEGEHGLLAAGQLTDVTGFWKSGKTTLISSYLALLRDGGSLAGMPVKPGRALVVTEESSKRWSRRAEEMQIPAEVVDKICRPFRRKPSWDDWYAFVEHAAALQVERRYDVIVADALPHLWPVVNENDSMEVLRAVQPLHTWAEAGAAVLLVRHPRKTGGEEATAGRGSGSLAAFVDVVVEFRRYVPKVIVDTRRVITVYSREEPFEVVVDWDGAVGYEVVGARDEVRRADRLSALLRQLPVDAPGTALDDILAAWEGDSGPKPGRGKAKDLLDQAEREGKVKKAGAGKRSDPYRYCRLVSVSGLPLIRGGNETEPAEEMP